MTCGAGSMRCRMAGGGSSELCCRGIQATQDGRKASADRPIFKCAHVWQVSMRQSKRREDVFVFRVRGAASRKASGPLLEPRLLPALSTALRLLRQCLAHPSQISVEGAYGHVQTCRR